jgi:hypothetical protein
MISALERLATGALFVLLGALLGIFGAFLVPERLPGGVEGVAVAVAVVGNYVAGRFAATGVGTPSAAGLPAVAWLAVVTLASVTRASGALIIPGSVAGDPGVGYTAFGFLVGGVVAAGAAYVRSRPRRGRRSRIPS